MFDRLAPEARSREESARSLAAARKSVFDRLRGVQARLCNSHIPKPCSLQVADALH